MDRALRPEDCRNEAVVGCDHSGADIEAIAVRFRVEMERDLVAAIVEEGFQLHQGAARMYVGFAPDASASGLSAHFGTNVEPLHRQLADMDVEAGQYWVFLAGWLQSGESIQGDSIGGHTVDVKLVGQPRSWRPIEVDLGGGQESAVAVSDCHGLELRLAEDRPVNAADVDAEARSGLQFANPVDDEAMSGRSVEEDQGPGKKNEQGDKQSEQLVEQPARPIGTDAPGRRPGFDWNRGLVHQNAWPSETVTAIGPSPFWRFSGTPTS